MIQRFKALYAKMKEAVNAKVVAVTSGAVGLTVLSARIASAEETYTNADVGAIVSTLVGVVTDIKTAIMALIAAAIAVAVVLYVTKFGFRAVKSILGRG